MELTLSSLPAVVSTTVVLRQDSITGTSATVLHNHNTGELSILDGDEGRESRISVATLPQSVPLQSMSSAVSIPSRLDPNSGEQCKLIARAKPLGVYYGDEVPSATHLPLVLRKDVRALRVENRWLRLQDTDDSSEQLEGSLSDSLW